MHGLPAIIASMRFVPIYWNDRRPSVRHHTLPDCRQSDDERTGTEFLMTQAARLSESTHKPRSDDPTC